MRWIVRASLKYRFLVVLLAATMVFFGSLQLRDSPVDVFPEFAPPLWWRFKLRPWGCPRPKSNSW